MTPQQRWELPPPPATSPPTRGKLGAAGVSGNAGNAPGFPPAGLREGVVVPNREQLRFGGDPKGGGGGARGCPPPPHHPTSDHHTRQRRWVPCVPQAWGQPRPWVHRVLHGLSSSSAQGRRAAPAHPRVGQVTARAPTGPANPAVPQGSGCQGSAGTPTPTAGAPMLGLLARVFVGVCFFFFLPPLSLPSAFPSASNFSSFAKTNPQVSRAGAASGSARPARRGGLLPASLLTPIQRRQSRRHRVPGADCCCLPARRGKGLIYRPTVPPRSQSPAALPPCGQPWASWRWPSWLWPPCTLPAPQVRPGVPPERGAGARPRRRPGASLPSPGVGGGGGDAGQGGEGAERSPDVRQGQMCAKDRGAPGAEVRQGGGRGRGWSRRWEDALAMLRVALPSPELCHHEDGDVSHAMSHATSPPALPAPLSTGGTPGWLGHPR